MSQVRLALVFIAILICAATTLWGFSQISLPTASPSAWNSLYRNVGFFIVGAVFVEAFARYFRIRRLSSGAIIACLIAIFTSSIWPLLISLCFAFSSYVLGLAILSALRIDKARISGLIAFLIGAGAYGTTVGLLAHFPINYSGLYGIALVIPVILGWHSINDVTRSLGKYITQADEFRWLDLTITLIALVHFSVALMPEVGHDALAMHLFIPGHLAHRHEWGFDVTTYVWAVMPMMGDWIFSLVYMLAGETAARMINVGFIFSLAWLVRDLVIWAGGNSRGARWAVLIFLTTPLTYTESSSLFIESVWASFIVAGTLSIFKVISANSEQRTHLPVAALLLGSALAAKAVTFSILPVLFLLLVLRYKLWLKINLGRTILLGLVLFLVVGTIPYITAWYITGNPVFPFFNEFFQAPQYPAVNFSASPIFEKGVSWDTIYRMTFESGKYLEGKPGAAGFQWLLLLIPTIIVLIVNWNRKGLALIIVGILAIALTFHQTAYLRYIYPSYVILSAALGVAFSIIVTSGNILLYRMVLIVSMIAIFLNLLFFKSGTHYGSIALQPMISTVGRNQYLQRRLPVRNAIDIVNELNVSRSPVAVFSSPLTAGLSADALYPTWYNYQFKRLVNKASNRTAIVDVLLSKGVEYVILDERWGSVEKRLMIEEVTDKISKLGTVTVRAIREKYRFNTELLKDTDLSMPDSWELSGGSRRTIEGIVVSKGSPATQVVAVTPGQKYLLSNKARCEIMPNMGRLQVNWTDIDGKFISTDIRVFDCTTSFTKYSMEVSPPSNAVRATVYATGHTIRPLVIKEVSFRK